MSLLPYSDRYTPTHEVTNGTRTWQLPSKGAADTWAMLVRSFIGITGDVTVTPIPEARP